MPTQQTLIFRLGGPDEPVGRIRRLCSCTDVRLLVFSPSCGKRARLGIRHSTCDQRTTNEHKPHRSCFPCDFLYVYVRAWERRGRRCVDRTGSSTEKIGGRVLYSINGRRCFASINRKPSIGWSAAVSNINKHAIRTFRPACAIELCPGAKPKPLAPTDTTRSHPPQ